MLGGDARTIADSQYVRPLFGSGDRGKQEPLLVFGWGNGFRVTTENLEAPCNQL